MTLFDFVCPTNVNKTVFSRNHLFVFLYTLSLTKLGKSPTLHLFQVVPQILYQAEVGRGGLQLPAGSQGLPVKLARAWGSQEGGAT